MTRRPSILLIVLTASAALLVVVSTSSCSKSRDVMAQDAAGSTKIQTVAVAMTQPADLHSDLVLTAEFVPFQEVDVMAKVSGYVKEIRVDVGDRVKTGDLLATLEVPEMVDEMTKATAMGQRSIAEVARAKDELVRAESAYEIAHLSYTRLAAVMQSRPGLLAQQDIDEAKSREQVTQAQVAAAKSALLAAERQVTVSDAEGERLRTMYRYTKVTAPFAGTVTKRYANTGSMIQAGTASQTQAMPLVRLSQNSLFRLTLPVPESVVPRVRLGQQVEVRVPSLSRSFFGKVARFADKIQSSTRTMETEVDVPNPTGVLVPGMYAEVNLTLDRKERALAIPVMAVDHDGGSTRVLVVSAANRIEDRVVTLGLETATLIEVKSGLNNGELVIIGNRTGLKPGQEVKPKKTILEAAKESE